MSRLRLRWFNLTQSPGQDLCLKIPVCAIYSSIIDRAFPRVEHIGWRETTKGTCYTYIKHIADGDRERLVDFLELLQSLVCCTITDHLAPHFARELDEAYALDFNFQQDLDEMVYTDAGRLEHDAKDKHDIVAVAKLADMIADVIRRHPSLSVADFIVGMPSRPAATFHLPDKLTTMVGKILGRDVGLKLTKAEHPKLRTLPVARKISTLAGVFALDEPVAGKTVLVIDDLYQAGVSAWSVARFLKGHGAQAVYAIACVKSWRDTDNI